MRVVTWKYSASWRELTGRSGVFAVTVATEGCGRGIGAALSFFICLVDAVCHEVPLSNRTAKPGIKKTARSLNRAFVCVSRNSTRYSSLLRFSEPTGDEICTQALGRQHVFFNRSANLHHFGPLKLQDNAGQLFRWNTHFLSFPPFPI